MNQRQESVRIPVFANGRSETIRITAPTRAGLLADLERLMAARQGFTLATLNLDHLVKLRKDADFMAAYQAHSHIVADGNPIIWLSRLAGQPVDLIPGSELVQPLAALAARTGTRVGLLGSTDEVLALTAQRLESAHPGLNVALRHAPPFGFDPTGAAADHAINLLREQDIGLCFLALGAPKQEIFAAYAAQSVPQCGFASVGAGLDFIAGSQVRAPKWVQSIAMEWAWRMASNPRRLARRYADCFAILPGLALQARRNRAAAQKET
ncbi:MAG: WecB/TagA/CpsF family glycosyltransferase [Paracoccus sp. (in: a-proteobacteria)]|uniref:WecB/TagA/CpsF family glycosyltransferase n=1 Tax=Paracoccus sp. TaxID=267 RepID=UPI0026E03733|nr:WecB/TagA/CpsF family glycosyltransferase [Paracoccus sp. (in: a-proteobacteria)]MDO5631047.1 WecB/TagA/CpsF family glycosyltransferase [Paracoccus sp. (in: a-proteobacteria)]